MLKIKEIGRLVKLFITINIVNLLGIIVLSTTKLDYVDYIMIPEILISALGTVIGIIVLVRKESGISANIGIAFLILSILGYARGMIIAVDYSFNVNLIYKSLLGVTVVFEVLAILLSLIFNKLKVSGIITAILFLGIEIFLFLIIYTLMNGFLTPYYVYTLQNITNVILHMISVLSVIGLAKYGKEYTRKINIIPNIIVYLLIINICIPMNNQNLLSNTKTILLYSFIKYVAYFILYEALSRRLIEQSYLEKEEELKEYKRIYERLNSMLQKRNVVLNELEMIKNRNIQRYLEILSSLNDGIMIFNSNKLYFSNAFIEDTLRKRYSIDYNNYSLDELFNVILNKKNSYIINYETGIKKNLESKYLIKPKNDDREFEMYTITISPNDKIVFLRDITYIKKYYEIKKEQDECRRRDMIKNEFYSNVSHELRTPINVISSALQLSDYYLKNNKLDLISNNTVKIKQNCLRLIRTINNFIDSNKISEGYLMPIKFNWNIVEVVENISNASTRYIDKINDKLIFDTEEEVIIVPIDKEMIERVMLNLLSNSVKHGENNKLIKIKIRRSENKDFVLIELENNSELICSETEPYLFDEFTKLNKEYNRKKEGSGLGLYLSKAIIEAHDGTIGFSKKNNKNIFTINLPIGNINNYKYQEDIELNFIDEKVDLEFADIYI